MKVLVIGGGGREHAIVWKLSQSPKVDKIFCAPGNPGIAELAECVSIGVNENAQLIDFVLKNQIDLTVVGPEEPLSNGIVDAFEEKNLPIFGPRKAAAIIEGSKTFAKDLMKKYSIPTAAYASFTDYDEALAYLHKQGAPIVIKADGLAAGKGVIVAMTMEEAEDALRSMMKDEQFGSAGASVVIEEFLQGEEMTLLSFVDGTTVKPMVLSQDHKQVFEGDKGPNTGGMGAYAPVPHFDQAVVDEVVERIVQPTVQAMKEEGRPFRGILYTGLMMTESGPKVIEYNARFGDPETQAILPLLKTDLFDIFVAGVSGELDRLNIEWSTQTAICVILASGGYPGSYEKGKVIEGLCEDTDGAVIFHAGTALKDRKIVTNGGRVLGVTSIGDDINRAKEAVYQAIQSISFDGMQYRRDIGSKARA